MPVWSRNYIREDNIKIVRKEIGCDVLECVKQSQNKIQWRPVNRMNQPVPKKKRLNRRATPLSASEGGFCNIKVLKFCFWWNRAFPEVAGLNVSGHTLLRSNNPRVQQSKLLTGRQQSGTEIGNLEHPHCSELQIFSI
jgi:hypothetical protein